MNLPDRFEQVGIVVGSVILVALPASALGVLIAASRLSMTYQQGWAFSL